MDEFYFRWSENSYSSIRKIPILTRNILRQKHMYGQNRYPVAVTLTIFHIGVMKNCSGVCSDDIISISDPKYRVVIVSKSYFGLK